MTRVRRSRRSRAQGFALLEFLAVRQYQPNRFADTTDGSVWTNGYAIDPLPFRWLGDKCDGNVVDRNGP